MNNLKRKIKSYNLLYKLYMKYSAFYISLKYILNGSSDSFEHFKTSIDYLFNRTNVAGLPTTITIEPVNVCNLKCPVCETGADILNRTKGYMSTEDFKKIINQIYTHTNTLIYYFMGEPFLNKKWVEQIQYAKKMGISKVETCTNGDFASAQDIVDSKIDKVSFQIGGMTQETHEKYRVGSNLERVINNLKEIIELKKIKKADWLTIDVGLIVMKHNEHEIDLVRNYCKEVGADTFTTVLPVVRNYEQGKIFLPDDEEYMVYDKRSLNDGKLVKSNKIPNHCPWMYYSTVILVNGDISPCCEDSTGKYIMGNMLEDDFKDIWNNKKYQSFRKVVNTKQKDLELCKLCSSYGVGQLSK